MIFQLVYFTMDILSQYLQPGTRIWNSIRSYVTNSTRIDLLRRLIQFGGDVATLREIHLNQPARALEILASRSFLTTIVGHMINFLTEEDVQNRTAFLNEYDTMLPRWNKVVDAFTNVNDDLKTKKYMPNSDDPNNFSGRNPVIHFKDTCVRNIFMISTNITILTIILGAIYLVRIRISP